MVSYIPEREGRSAYTALPSLRRKMLFNLFCGRGNGGMRFIQVLCPQTASPSLGNPVGRPVGNVSAVVLNLDTASPRRCTARPRPRPRACAGAPRGARRVPDRGPC